MTSIRIDFPLVYFIFSLSLFQGIFNCEIIRITNYL